MKTQQHTSLNRRQFCLSALAATSAALVPRPAQSEAARSAYRYNDIHTHLGQPWGNRPELTPEGLLKWMDTNEIGKACVLPLINPEAWDHPISTDYVLLKTEPYRDRLIPFCAIDPRVINLSGQKAKVDQLKRYQDAGAKGFGESKPGVKMDDPRNMELFAACAEVGFPVLFHLDNSRNTDQAGLPGLEKVLEALPEGRFIGHAQGWWASIDGAVTQDQLQKYPEGTVAEGGALDRLMAKYPNLYGDLSAGSGANAIMRDLDFGREFLIRNQDRLLFGTDYLAPGQNVPQLSLYREIDLPESVQAKIYRDNHIKLLGL